MTLDGAAVVGSGSLCAVLLGFYIVLRLRQGPRSLFLPDSFLIGLVLFAAGGIIVARTSPSPEAHHVAMLGNGALLSGIAGTIVAVLATGHLYRGASFRGRLVGAPWRRFDRLFAMFAGATVASVTLAFVYLVLTGPVAVVFRSFAAFVSDAALLDVRKAIASGREGYLAPGYVKQFRDILGPVLVVYLGWQTSRRERLGRLLLLVLLVGAILLSGQRAPLLILVLSVLAGGYLARRQRGYTPRAVALTALASVASLIFLFLLAGIDLLLGRAADETLTWTAPFSSLASLLERAIVTVPQSNLATYDLWMFRGPTGGQSWLQELVALLPGPAEEMFSNVLHEAGGGSAEGNLVLGMAPDLWLAWGWPGVLIVPALFAGCVALLDIGLLRAGSQIALATRIYLFFALPIMYSPYGFALYGGAVALIVLASIAVWKGLALLAADRPRGDKDRGSQKAPIPPVPPAVPTAP